MSYHLPLFPLGSVLFPGQRLPLHIFEPRYRALVAHCLGSGGTESSESGGAVPVPEFGVVLITRGHEVGGYDDRCGTGTVARIVEVGEFPDGRFALEAVGVRRFRVDTWLPDDPFPQALVVDIDEPECALDPEQLSVVDLRMRACVAELTGRADVVYQLPDDHTHATFLLAMLLPVASPDRQRLLDVPDCAARLALIDELLTGWELLHSLALDDS